MINTHTQPANSSIDNHVISSRASKRTGSPCSPESITRILQEWHKENSKLSGQESAAKLLAQGCTQADIEAYNTTKNAAHPQPVQQYQLATFQPDLLKVDRKVCHDRTSPFSYLVLPAKDGQEGLFPMGELSMFAGASGTWKTSVELFIRQWEKGERWFRRPTCPNNGKYLIVSFDRSKDGFVRTAVRMSYDPNDFKLIDLGQDEYSDRDPGEIIHDILSQAEFRDIQFLLIEGIDLKVGDVDEPITVKGKNVGTTKVKGGISDTHVVARLVRSLRKSANEQRFALVVSVGSPKQKAGSKYISERDQVIGSATWGRMVETLIFLEQEDECASARRTMSILPRNGKDEALTIMLDRENRPIEAPPEPPKDARDAWTQIIEGLETDKLGIKPGDTFTPKQVQDALPHLSYDNVAKTLQRMAKNKNIEKADHGAYRRSPQYVDGYEGQIDARTCV
jgi:hypothetical protein